MQRNWSRQDVMGFEKFEGTGSMETSSEPHISLRKSGSIGVSKAATQEHLEDTEAVSLYFDKEENKIGIEPVEEGAEHSYTLSHSEDGGSRHSCCLYESLRTSP